MSDRRASQKWIGAIVLLVLMSIVLYFISSAIGYFGTGASKEDIYHADERYFEKARPLIEWAKDDPNIEGSINPYLREDIAKGFFQGIRTLNLSRELKENVALEEHFDVDLVDKILNSISKQKTSIKQINLSHRLKLHFLSFDKTVVSFTDERSKIKQKIDGVYLDDSVGYHVNMTLVDGRWRIDALEQTIVEIPNKETTVLTIDESSFLKKGINYYPADAPWYKFWEQYDEEIIEEDFKLIRTLDYRMVRFFIPFEIFGAGMIDIDMVEKLDHFIAQAEENKIDLVPCLFDFPIGYELQKYPQYDRQLEFVLNRYKNRETIIAWDLKNEPDLDFENQGEETTLQWLEFIVERAGQYSDKPLTVGWSKYSNAHLICEGLDLISFHYYTGIGDLESAIISAKSYCQKPVMISEYGMSTYSGIWPGGHSEEEQADYYSQFQDIMDGQEVGGIAWCLYDYKEAPSTVFGRKPWIKAQQKKFGILREDGSKKKVTNK